VGVVLKSGGNVKKKIYDLARRRQAIHTKRSSACQKLCLTSYSTSIASESLFSESQNSCSDGLDGSELVASALLASIMA